MNAPSSLPPSRFPTLGKIRTFFGWKFWRRCVLGLAIVATLTGLFYAEENVRGKRAWEKYRADQEAKGMSFDLMTYVPPEVPDDQNFAMTPFLAPLYDFIPGTQKSRDTNGFKRTQDFAKDLRADRAKLVGWPKGEWINFAGLFEEQTGNSGSPAVQTNRMEMAARTLALLKEFEPVVEEIRAASRRPHARFKVQYQWENPAAILLPHLGVIRRVCQVLVLRASAELAMGQADRAFDDLTLTFYLTENLKAEPIVISQLVRFACHQMALQALWEGLATHQWTDAQLRQIEARFKGANFMADNIWALNGGERAGMAHGIFDMIRKNPALLRDIAGEPSGQNGGDWNFLRLYPKGWFYLEEINYHRLFEAYVLPGTDTGSKRLQPAVIQGNGERLSGELSHNPFKLVAEHRVMSALLLPALGNIHKKGGTTQCAADLAGVACALERWRLKNGGFPESLEALVPTFLPAVPRDVVGGQPVKYQRTTDGQFILYSVGWNEKDDGGTVVLKENKRDFDVEHGDWVWRYPAKLTEASVKTTNPR